MRKGRRCPRCGSTNTAEILYGMPAFSEKLEKDINEGKVVLGGCIVRSVPVNGEAVYCDPERQCNDCGKEFGTPPLLIAKDYSSAEDYRDIVREIRFYEKPAVGYSFGDFIARKTDNGAVVMWGGKESHISADKWNEILDTLYTKVYLHEWKKTHWTFGILDGEEWGLSLKLTNGRVRNYKGFNAYPPYWSALQKLLTLR